MKCQGTIILQSFSILHIVIYVGISVKIALYIFMQSHSKQSVFLSDSPFIFPLIYLCISFSIFINNHGWTTWGVGVPVLGVEYGRGHRKVPWEKLNIIIIIIAIIIIIIAIITIISSSCIGEVI